MANQLIDESRLGRMAGAGDVKPTQETEMSEKEEATRCWLYSLACPGGKIFEGEAIDAALDGGEWRDTPPPQEVLDEIAAEAAGDEQGAEAALVAADKAIAARDARIAELEAAGAEVAGTLDECEAELAAEKKAHSATKGQLTKLQNAAKE